MYFALPPTMPIGSAQACIASEPVLRKQTRSLPVTSQNSREVSMAAKHCGPISRPVASCFWIASVTKSGEWPRKFGPKPLTKSTYSLPSTSHSREPFMRVATT